MVERSPNISLIVSHKIIKTTLSFYVFIRHVKFLSS